MSTAVVDLEARETAQPARRAYYVPALDGLRTLAFLMVFIDHACWWENQFPGTPIWARKVWLATVPTCGVGVSLFFILSSFLITTLLRQEKKRTGKISIPSFYMRRILRIWPLYFAVVALCVFSAPYLVNRAVRPEAIWALVTFRTNFGNHPSLPQPLGPMWSIAMEEQFYLIWPLVVLFADRKTLIQISVGLVLFANGWRAYEGYFFVPRSVIWSHPFSQLDCFGYGALIAVFHRRLNLAWLKPKGLAIAGLLLCLPIIEFFWPFRYYPNNQAWGVEPALAGGPMMLILGLVALMAVKTRTGILTHPVAISLGKRTYGFYCFHLLVFVFLWKFEPKEHYLATVLPALLLILILGYLSYRWFEMPFLRLKERFQTVRSGAA